MDSKRTRVSTNTEDTISSLPDGVICHILSFLPTEESVRTRVLSTRWKQLFSLVPVLDFKYECSTNPTSSSASSDRIIRFLDFVDWVFNSYKAHPMDKFRLKAYGLSTGPPQETSRVLSWISESVRLGVRELDVSVCFPVPQMFPRGVFNCETLTDLSITGNFVLDVPDGACLPGVKNIWLFSACFVDCHSARRLFKSCPVLEELLLCLSHSGDIQVIDIVNPTLKRLDVILNYNDNYDLVLNTPNLDYLDYTGYIPHGLYSDQGLKSLNKAFIYCLAHFHGIYEPLEKIFSAACHVRALRICTYTMESLQRSGCSLPIFHNLTRLEIKVVTSFDAGFIAQLLLVMPNLEVLVVENDEYDNIHSHVFPEDVPTCVSHHLKEVTFMGFYMMEHEFKLVEYFLKNAEVLDTLKIESEDSVENQFDMSVELLTYPRYSSTCQIVLT